MSPKKSNSSHRRKSQHRLAKRIAQEVVAAMRPYMEQQNANLNPQPTIETHAPHKIETLETNTETKKPTSKKRKAESSQNFATNTSSNPTDFHIPHPTMFFTSYSFPYYPQPTFVQPIPPNRRYMGNFPQCATCGYHHSVGYACRWCTTCNRYGHVATTCRVSTPPIYAPTPLNTVYPVCYSCGEQTHLARDCPNKR